MDDINLALKLNYSLKAALPKLAVEKPEFEAILASDTESRLNFDIALNASEQQAKIYNSLLAILWQKVLTMTTANTEFNLLNGFDLAIVIGIIVTGINSIAIGILCMGLKAISMLLLGVKVAKADFIFSHPMTSTKTAKPNVILAELIWQAVKNALTDLIGLKAIMIIILILLFIGLIIKINKIKKAIFKCQTKMYIYFECPTFTLKKHLSDLTYSSNYYKIRIKNRMLTIKFFFFRYIALNDCIQITNKLTKINGVIPKKFTYFHWKSDQQFVCLQANSIHC